MRIVVEGSTPEELMADLKLAMSIVAQPSTNPAVQEVAVAPASANQPPAAPAAPAQPPAAPASSPAAPAGSDGKRYRRTKEEKAWDDAHGLKLKDRKDINAVKAAYPQMDDAQALNYIRSGGQIPGEALPAQPPAAPAQPPAMPMATTQGAVQAAAMPHPQAVTSPAPGAPAPAQPPVAPQQQAQVMPDGSIGVMPVAPQQPVAQFNVGAAAPAMPATGNGQQQPQHDHAHHANPAADAPITDVMLQNAFQNLMTNVSQDAAIALLSEAGYTSVADIPMEIRPAIIAQIEEQVRAAG